MVDVTRAAVERAAGRRQDITLHVATSTLVKLLLTAAIVWAGLVLWPEMIVLTVSLLLAVALEPLVESLERRRIPRGVAIAGLAVVSVVAIAAAFAFVLPPLASQAKELSANLPGLKKRVDSYLEAQNPTLKALLDKATTVSDSPEVSAELNKPLAWGSRAASGVVNAVLALVATFYLLLDGRRLYAWLVSYVPRVHRDKLAQTVPEVSDVVHAYVRGQAITSVMFGIFVAIVLSVLKVPAMLPLALLAAVCDIIPVVGIIVATVPAALLALTQSPLSCAAVFGLYGGYHLFETYVIVPRVYGNTLRLSTLTVLLSLIVGASLQGILGAILILPVVAAYPIIERIWLGRYLAREVLADHAALSHQEEKTADAAVDAVLEGQPAALPGGPPSAP